MATTEWTRVADVADFPADGGAAVKFGDAQVAIFHFAATDKWYACDNVCPHKMQPVLARGIVGDKGGVPVVACPMHKRPFSLESGKCLDDDLAVKIYSVQVKDGGVYLAVQ